MANPDKLLFASKAEADARDKILELAEELTVFLQARVKDLSEEQAEQVSLVIAEHKDLIQKALKKPSVLNEGVD